jgi:hypothetical protein
MHSMRSSLVLGGALQPRAAAGAGESAHLPPSDALGKLAQAEDLPARTGGNGGRRQACWNALAARRLSPSSACPGGGRSDAIPGTLHLGNALIARASAQNWPLMRLCST